MSDEIEPEILDACETLVHLGDSARWQTRAIKIASHSHVALIL